MKFGSVTDGYGSPISGGSSLVTTGSVGSDVYAFVSGTIGLSGSSAKKTLFGGDVVVSGSLSGLIVSPYSYHPVSLFTTPPAESNWTALFSSVNVITASNYPNGAINFDHPAGKAGFYKKNLVSPGGSHVVVMYIAADWIPANTSDASGWGPMLVGATKGIRCDIEYVSGAPQRVIQRFTNSNGAYETNLVLTTAGTDTANFPFAPSWWRLTFDDNNVTVERYCPASGILTQWYSGGHGCGAIQSAGVYVSANTRVNASLLSYTET